MWGYGNGYFYLLTGPTGDYRVAVSVPGQGLGQAAAITLDDSGLGAAVLVTDNPQAQTAEFLEGSYTFSRHLMRLAIFAADGTPVPGYTGKSDRHNQTGPWDTMMYYTKTTVIAPGVYQKEYGVSVYESGTVTLTLILPDGIKATESIDVELVDRRCQSTVYRRYYDLPVEELVGEEFYVRVSVIDANCQGVEGLDEEHFRAELGDGLSLVEFHADTQPGGYFVWIRAHSLGEHTIFPAYDDTKAVATGDAMDELMAVLRLIVDIIRALIQTLIDSFG